MSRSGFFSSRRRYEGRYRDYDNRSRMSSKQQLELATELLTSALAAQDRPSPEHRHGGYRRPVRQDYHREYSHSAPRKFGSRGFVKSRGYSRPFKEFPPRHRGRSFSGNSREAERPKPVVDKPEEKAEKKSFDDSSSSERKDTSPKPDAKKPLKPHVLIPSEYFRCEICECSARSFSDLLEHASFHYKVVDRKRSIISNKIHTMQLEARCNEKSSDDFAKVDYRSDFNSKWCKVCKCYYSRRTEDEHNNTNFHKELENVLSPHCVPCGRKFPNALFFVKYSYLSHTVTMRHIMRNYLMEPYTLIDEIGTLDLPEEVDKLDVDFARPSTETLNEDSKIEQSVMDGDQEVTNTFHKFVRYMCSACSEVMKRESDLDTHVCQNMEDHQTEVPKNPEETPEAPPDTEETEEKQEEGDVEMQEIDSTIAENETVQGEQ